METSPTTRKPGQWLLPTRPGQLPTPIALTMATGRPVTAVNRQVALPELPTVMTPVNARWWPIPPLPAKPTEPFRVPARPAAHKIAIPAIHGGAA